jgi:Holliday junction resolvase RusA-like endonuclease
MLISLTTPAAEDYPSDVAVVLELIFFLPRPKNVPANVKFPSMCKPDNSNVRKAIEDAMTGLVYDDDRQIVDGHDHKRFCAEGDEPHIRILLWKAGNRFG